MNSLHFNFFLLQNGAKFSQNKNILAKLKIFNDSFSESCNFEKILQIIAEISYLQKKNLKSYIIENVGNIDRHGIFEESLPFNFFVTILCLKLSKYKSFEIFEFQETFLSYIFHQKN